MYDLRSYDRRLRHLFNTRPRYACGLWLENNWNHCWKQWSCRRTTQVVCGAEPKKVAMVNNKITQSFLFLLFIFSPTSELPQYRSKCSCQIPTLKVASATDNNSRISAELYNIYYIVRLEHSTFFHHCIRFLLHVLFNRLNSKLVLNITRILIEIG